MTLTIGFTYDARSDYLAAGFPEEQIAEFDSDETIGLLEEAMVSLGHTVSRVGSARSLCQRLVAGDRWDLVFNIAEGLEGRCREAQIPAVLELYGIPYTFSDPLVCAVTLDKTVAKRLVASAGINTPRSALVATPADVSGVDLNYPLFAKPNAEGTGKGIDATSRIMSPGELENVCRHLLERCRQPVLVEEFLPGREFTVGILGTGSAARVIGTMEIEILQLDLQGIYSYTSKEECEHLVRYSRLADGDLKTAVETLALAAYRVLECRDGGRVDVRLDAAGDPSFLEVNPLPGLHPTHSDLPMIATQEGMSYRELIGGS